MDRPRFVPLATVLLLGSLAGQQEAAPNRTRAAEGTALLTALVAAQKDMAQMTADYVQYRTTKLFHKPLVSSGTMTFRREPGCVVFAVAEPRQSVIRLDTEKYEVWHADKKRLERYVLPSPEMPRLLFDALAPTKARLADGFAVADCEPADDEPTWRRLTLLPTAAKTKKIAAEITLLIDPKGPSLRGFGYQDPRGDDVRIELGNVQVAAEADDARFRLDLPADAKVMVHHVPAEPPGEAPAKDRAAKDPAAKDPAASDKAAPQPSRRG